MPMLQVDGRDIADIGEELASRLIEASKQGSGTERQKHIGQMSVKFSLPAHKPPKKYINVELEFPESPDEVD
ncbi:MAG TPA: hypothetical protein VGC09_00380 [Rhodopila sp.]